MVERASSFHVARAEEGTVQNSGVAATRERPVGLRTKIFEAEVGKVSLPVPACNLQKRYINTVCQLRLKISHFCRSKSSHFERAVVPPDAVFGGTDLVEL